MVIAFTSPTDVGPLAAFDLTPEESDQFGEFGRAHHRAGRLQAEERDVGVEVGAGLELGGDRRHSVVEQGKVVPYEPRHDRVVV